MANSDFYPKNLAFFRTAEGLYPYGRESYGSRNKHLMKFAETGGMFMPDGSILFRIYAPEAVHVCVSCEGLTIHHGDQVDILQQEATGDDFPEYRLELTKNDEGFFEGSLTKDDLAGFYGPFPYTFVVDGAYVVHPWSRSTWRAGRLMNCVEVPDPDYEDDFIIREGIGHGSVVYDMFYSEVRGDWSPILVYLPNDYMTSGKKYPVLYLQHGGGENETGWVNLANLPEIMDNLIADGRAVPFVIVMNNTRIQGKPKPGIDYRPGQVSWDAARELITEECIPYIESKYRVYTDKAHRAIAGLSMGSMQTSYIGFSRPDLFSCVGMFSGSVRVRRVWNDYNESPHLAIFREGCEALAREYKVIYRGCGYQEHESRPWHKEDDRWLHELGVDVQPFYHYTLHPTMCHEWGCFRRSLRDFVQLIFKD